RTIRESVCGFEKKLGKGAVIHIGTWFGFDTEGHKPVYEIILKKSGAKLRQASASNENITVRERFTDDNSAILFVGNYYNEEQPGKITYTHPGNGEEIVIPYSKDEFIWPALYSVLTPVCLELSEGLSILHSTSDILDIAENNKGIQISLYGDRDLAGEMVLEGPATQKINSANIDGEPVQIFRDKKYTSMNYIHKHRCEMILNVKIRH
ncbi:MAG: hypothetical protein ACNA7V_09020, partial [Bacteroidales bacterium]